MKELSIEQKAKRYDDALERAKGVIEQNPLMEYLKKGIEYIFPELRESEDEKIRNFLIDFIKACGWTEKKDQGWPLRKECISWLEKQGEYDKIVEKAKSEKQRVLLTETNGNAGIDWDTCSLADTKMLLEYGLDFINKKLEKQVEQKPADKVEQKFHEGDWVVNRFGDAWHIDSFDSKNYQVSNGDKHCYFPIKKQNEMHLWTIQDAKDGDVLCCESGWTCIFKRLVNDETFSSYCFMDKTKWFCATGSECHTLKEEFIKAYNGKIHPATKEQRDLLFQEMKEAGYVWDAEKKELKKIEQKPVELSQEELDALEREIVRLSTLNLDADKNLKEISLWKTYFLSLSHKQNPAWSEEDDQYLLVCKNALAKYQVSDKWDATIISRWLEDKLKSLRPQNAWKPSDEQMVALEHAINCYSGISPTNTEEVYTLEIMKEQLKKLTK